MTLLKGHTYWVYSVLMVYDNNLLLVSCDTICWVEHPYWSQYSLWEQIVRPHHSKSWFNGYWFRPEHHQSQLRRTLTAQYHMGCNTIYSKLGHMDILISSYKACYRFHRIRLTNEFRKVAYRVALKAVVIMHYILGTGRYSYNAVRFLQNIHKIHP